MRLRNFFAVSVSALLLITGATATGAAPETKEVYIIKFADNANLDNEIAALKAGGGTIKREYRNLFKGVAFEMTSGQAIALSKNPRIQLVEKNQVFTTQVTDSITDSGLWGLDRIDQTIKTLDKKYSYTYKGTGIPVYIVDTGIDSGINTQFGNRAKFVANYTDDGKDFDCQGHGTHVAGTVGSATYGVAKDVTLLGYKVLDCNGSGFTDGIVKALGDISTQPIGVVNMSLGGSVSQALNDAVTVLTNKGFIVVVAAGNSRTDACKSSPASAPSAITVAASNISDKRASFSNYGRCVDIFAPGEGIKSLQPGGTLATWSGTSMASPHVAGVVARLLNSGVASASIESTLKSSKSVVSLDTVAAKAGTPKVLLYADPSK